MIISKAPRLTPEQLREVEAIVGEYGCRIQVIVGAHREVYAILGDERHELMFNRLSGLDFVDRVDHIESSYRLMDAASELAHHAIRIGEVTLGEQPLFIAGPCTVDPKNPNLTYETAAMVREAGAAVLRGGVWKPRTMPYSFQGDDASLKIMLEARERTGLPLNIEVMDLHHLDMAVQAGVEMLQVGTRNALNYPLLRAIGEKTAGSATCVLLKRGRHMASIDEFICAAEYIAMAGNPNVLLCPRGTMPELSGYRNHPDESITP
ncbi:MAG: 3-deoxy-D-arabino-heptulosonate 7-phosphate synthase, partial [Verrucomicrobiota bacterium]